MAFLETSVVVYLREIFYPEGFGFPLKIVTGKIAVTEIIREFAALLMLITIGLFSGRNKTEKFAWFLYSFAIWDIFYYVFLKLLLDWPVSLFTWDILFLIPVVWVGPVIAPLINSVTMVLLSAAIIRNSYFSQTEKIRPLVWGLLIIGSLIVIVSYTFDYLAYLGGRFRLLEILKTSNRGELISYSSQYMPLRFNWLVFYTGVFCHLLAIFILFTDVKKNRSENAV